MKLLKSKSSINKLLIILIFKNNIAYKIFIVKKRNRINNYLILISILKKNLIKNNNTRFVRIGKG
jgi:hypothetical protein